MRLLHEDDLLRCFRNSVSVTYVSTLPSTSSSAPCISSFVQSLSTFETNVREWHFVQHSPYVPHLTTGGDEVPLTQEPPQGYSGEGETRLTSEVQICAYRHSQPRRPCSRSLWTSSLRSLSSPGYWQSRSAYRWDQRSRWRHNSSSLMGG